MEGPSLLPSSPTLSVGKEEENNETSPAAEAAFQCHICTEAPTDPVATSCGHVFCWPCIHRWIQDRPKPCPVCRTVLKTRFNILALCNSATGPEKSSRPPNPALFIPIIYNRVGDERGYTEDYKGVTEVVKSALKQRRRNRRRMSKVEKKLNDMRRRTQL